MSENHFQDPMLKSPRKLPGARTKPLSPYVFLEATLPGDLNDTEDLRPSFGLTEVKLESISAKGIQLMGERFQSPSLSGFISKRPGGKTGSFIASFDFADAVRGALDSIDLYEVDAAGRRRLLFSVPNVHAPQPDPNPAEIEKERRAHEKALLAIRDNSRLQLEAVRRGEQARVRMLQAQAERAQRQKTTRHGAIVAAPIESRKEPPGRRTEQSVNRLAKESRARAGSSSEGPDRISDHSDAPTDRNPTMDRLKGSAPTGFEEE